MRPVPCAFSSLAVVLGRDPFPCLEPLKGDRFNGRHLKIGQLSRLWEIQVRPVREAATPDLGVTIVISCDRDPGGSTRSLVPWLAHFVPLEAMRCTSCFSGMSKRAFEDGNVATKTSKWVCVKVQAPS